MVMGRYSEATVRDVFRALYSMDVAYLLLLTFLINCADVSNQEPSLNIAQGLYHAFWAILVESRESVLAALPDKSFTISIPRDVTIPPDKAIIVLEMGEEHDCGPTWPSSLRTNFGEFKFEIPWVNVTKTNTAPFLYKSLILQSKEAEVVGSELLYDLNAHLAEIQLNSTSYMVDINGKTLKAVFQNVSGHETFQNASEYPNFSVYKDIVSQAWFGKSDSICAKHTYDFDHAMVRPVTMSLTVSKGLFPNFNLSGEVTSNGINYPLGVAEIWANFTMTAPTSCN